VTIQFDTNRFCQLESIKHIDFVVLNTNPTYYVKILRKLKLKSVILGSHLIIHYVIMFIIYFF